MERHAREELQQGLQSVSVGLWEEEAEETESVPSLGRTGQLCGEGREMEMEMNLALKPSAINTTTGIVTACKKQLLCPSLREHHNILSFEGWRQGVNCIHSQQRNMPLQTASNPGHMSEMLGTM